MALTSEQIKGLDIASIRKQQGRASAADLRNLGYATKTFGYKYKPATTPAPNQSIQALQGQGYNYLGTQQGIKDAIAKYGTGRVKNIGGNFFILPAAIKKPNITQPIPAGNLGAYQDLSGILGSNITPDMVSPEIAGLLALQGKATKGDQEVSDVQKQILEQMKSLGGQGADVQAELEKAGVPQALQQVKELTLKAAQLQGELSQFDVQTKAGEAALGDTAMPVGLIQGNQAKLQQQRDLTRLGKAAELSGTIGLAEAYKGNIQIGTELARQAVDLKYQPILSNIETLQTQLGFAQDKLSKDDQKRAGIIGELLRTRQEEIAEQKNKEQQIQELAIGIASMGAPLGLVQNIARMTDPVQAAQAAGAWKRQFDLSEEARRKGVGDKDKLQPSPGFFDAGIEQDVRATYDELLASGVKGNESYSRLRSMFSPNEVNDVALKALTKTTPLPPPVVDPSIVSRQQAQQGSGQPSFIQSIGNFLFGRNKKERASPSPAYRQLQSGSRLGKKK